jgi:hypothetical protein
MLCVQVNQEATILVQVAKPLVDYILCSMVHIKVTQLANESNSFDHIAEREKPGQYQVQVR